MSYIFDVTLDLKDECPDCDGKLYAYYHECSSGDPETGSWNVECNTCSYEPEDKCFPSIFSMNRVFKVDKKFSWILKTAMSDQGRKWTWLASKMNWSKNKMHRKVLNNSFSTPEEEKIKKLLGL